LRQCRPGVARAHSCALALVFLASNEARLSRHAGPLARPPTPSQVPASAPGAPGGRMRILLRVEVEPHPLFQVWALAGAPASRWRQGRRTHLPKTCDVCSGRPRAFGRQGAGGIAHFQARYDVRLASSSRHGVLQGLNHHQSPALIAVRSPPSPQIAARGCPRSQQLGDAASGGPPRQVSPSFETVVNPGAALGSRQLRVPAPPLRLQHPPTPEA
jgi:hypothetical protein